MLLRLLSCTDELMLASFKISIIFCTSRSHSCCIIPNQFLFRCVLCKIFFFAHISSNIYAHVDKLGNYNTKQFIARHSFLFLISVTKLKDLYKIGGNLSRNNYTIFMRFGIISISYSSHHRRLLVQS